ncbi:MAG: type III pantothenate kinase [Cycloclasticus sp.]|nr:type III pantothenate kinase [Cycloclasticus sp.]
MSKLFIDRGNTALKWQVFEGGVLRDTGVANKNLSLEEALDQLSCLNYSAVFVSSVGEDDFCINLSKWAADQGHTSPVFFKSAAQAGGVTNAYAEPSQLGVDRWLAMIAAHNKYSGMLCVVDSGTALTMDFISNEGLHLGGFIVPGAELMKSSLLDNTQKITLQVTQPAGQLGKNTTAAVSLGIQQMLRAFVLQQLAEMEINHQQKIALIMTGGHAEELAKDLSVTALIENDLVFQGMRILSEQSA